MQTLADAQALAAYDPEWCLFWADHVRATQFDIWAPYLRRSRHRTVIMASADGIPDRVRTAVEGLPRCAIAEPFADVLPALHDSPSFRGFMYVVSYLENAAAMEAFPYSAHVWVGHGESAKNANAHRTASVYDSVFVADYAAVGRYPRTIRRRLAPRACAIGVPVVEGLDADPRRGPRPVRTVIYAPTWEGSSPGGEYTSLEAVGPALLEALPALAKRGITVLLRPHPGTGKRRPELKHLLAELRAAGAIRSVDKGADLTRADVMISDVSGVTSEFLFSRKPIVLPVTPYLLDIVKGEGRLRREYPWAYRWDVANERLDDLLTRLETSDPLATTRARAARAMFRGHTSVAAAVETFDLALDVVGSLRARIPHRVEFETRRRLAGRRRHGVPT